MPSLHETDLGPLGMLVLDPRYSFSIVLWVVTISTESESCSVMSDPFLPHGLLHGILQAIMGWVPFSFSRISSQSRDQTQGSNPGLPHCRWILYQPQGKPKNIGVDSLTVLQQIFLTQELNRGFQHCRQILY